MGKSRNVEKWKWGKAELIRYTFPLGEEPVPSYRWPAPIYRRPVQINIGGLVIIH